ncbi:MAG: 50S ribosomal protein L29 [Candidatus Diapherotrites archaeon]|nr:50S ribosomal protein L29 [Candidatus Diapherotrites archaeon]
MKVHEVRELNNEQAVEKIREFRTEIARERALQSSGSKPENPGRIGALKKNIARILTILHERTLNPSTEIKTEKKETKVKVSTAVPKKETKPKAKKVQKKKGKEE